MTAQQLIADLFNPATPYSLSLNQRISQTFLALGATPSLVADLFRDGVTYNQSLNSRISQVFTALGASPTDSFRDGVSYGQSLPTRFATIATTVLAPLLPGAISDLTATAQSDTEIELDWTEADNAVTHEYRADNGPAIAGEPPTTVSDLTAETEYSFKVRGINTYGNGPWSNTAMEETEASGGGAYTAEAVHFDGTTWLVNEAITTPANNPHFTLAFWLKTADINDNAYAEILTVDFEDAYTPVVAIETDPFDIPIVNTIYDDFHSADSSSGDDAASNEIPPLGPNALVPGSWLWFGLCVDVSDTAISGNRVHKMFVDDTDITVPGNALGIGFDIVIDSKEVYVGGYDGAGIKMDVADFWCAPSQFIDFTIEANRRKFIDAAGKPVDLGADGSTPTGTAPAIFFSGDHATFGTNKGTGGSFTLTGTLTDATTSPND